MSCHPHLLHKLNIITNVPWAFEFRFRIQILIFMVNTQICTCNVKDATNIWKTWSNTMQRKLVSHLLPIKHCEESILMMWSPRIHILVRTEKWKAKQREDGYASTPTLLPLRFSSPTVDGGWCWPFQYRHNAVIVFTCCVIISMLAVCGPATIWQDYTVQ